MDTETLLRAILPIEKNDPSFKKLSLSPRGVFPPNIYTWARTGVAVGRSQHLLEIYFGSSFFSPTSTIPSQCIEAFCESACSNKSIRLITFRRIHDGEDLFRNLSLFFESNPCLTECVVCGCIMAREEIRLLCSNFSRCASLRAIKFSHNSWSDDLSEELFASLKGVHSLESLTFCQKMIGQKSFEALAALIQSPNSQINHLSLHSSGINDDILAAIATGLEKNRNLVSLDLKQNDRISFKGWGFLTHTLRHSNHYLQRIDFSDDDLLPKELVNLLRMNGRNDKHTLAIRKSLIYDFLIEEFDAKSFSDIDRCLLPDILSLITAGHRTENSCLPALFHFVRNMHLLVARNQAASGKRG